MKLSIPLFSIFLAIGFAVLAIKFIHPSIGLHHDEAWFALKAVELKADFWRVPFYGMTDFTSGIFPRIISWFFLLLGESDLTLRLPGILFFGLFILFVLSNASVKNHWWFFISLFIYPLFCGVIAFEVFFPSALFCSLVLSGRWREDSPQFASMAYLLAMAFGVLNHGVFILLPISICGYQIFFQNKIYPKSVLLVVHAVLFSWGKAHLPNVAPMWGFSLFFASLLLIHLAPNHPRAVNISFNYFKVLGLVYLFIMQLIPMVGSLSGYYLFQRFYGYVPYPKLVLMWSIFVFIVVCYPLTKKDPAAQFYTILMIIFPLIYNRPTLRHYLIPYLALIFCYLEIRIPKWFSRASLAGIVILSFSTYKVVTSPPQHQLFKYYRKWENSYHFSHASHLYQMLKTTYGGIGTLVETPPSITLPLTWYQYLDGESPQSNHLVKIDYCLDQEIKCDFNNFTIKIIEK